MNRRKIINFCILVVAVMLVSFSTVFATESLTTETSEGAYWKVEEYQNVADYKVQPPTKAGYLFAGWFSEESCAKETALKDLGTVNSAYAKFVPEEVLGLKAQINGKLWDKNTANDDQGGVIRFATSVDSLAYAKVGFKIDIGNGEKSKESNKVYEQVFVNVGDPSQGKREDYKPCEVFHKSSQYFTTWTVSDIPSGNYGTEFKVTPFWVTLDGTEVRGTQSIRTVNQGRTWEYVFVDDSGNDTTGAGTKGNPYNTLEKALSEMQVNKEFQIENIVGESKVNLKGTVYVKESLTAADSFTWNAHGLDVAISGKAPTATETATVNFSALTNLKMGDAATFEDMNLVFPSDKKTVDSDGNEKTTAAAVYANGHRLEIAESVTVDASNAPKVFGGSTDAAVKSTHVTLLAGNYANIYAGGESKDVTGDTYIYIGGTVNKDVLKNTEASLHNKNTGKDNLQIFGGSYNATVSGDTHVTVGGSALINYVRGGGNGSKQVVNGTCYVTLQDNAAVYGINGGGNNGSVNNTYVVVNGGTVYQVMGGMTTAGGTVNSTSVQVLGGTVNRRIYGGSYNEDDGSLLASNWKDTAYHVNGYSTVTIGNDAKLNLNTDADRSLCAVSRNGKNVAPETGIMVLNCDKTEQKVGFQNMGLLTGADLYTHFLVKVDKGGAVVSEGGVLRITPDAGTPYATVKDANNNVLFQCQGEGTCPYELLGEKKDSVQNITVEFSNNAELSGKYVLSYGEDSASYFDTLSDALAAVSTPKVSTDGVITQKTATIAIGEDCTVDATLVIEDGDNVVLKNKDDVKVTIKRGASLTGTGQFVFDVIAGGSLTIDGTLTVDGNGVEGPSMIDNKGTFTLGANATLQNAKSKGNGAALFNRGGDATANLYGKMTGNKAKQGGALANSGEAIIYSGEYSNNTSTAEGGAIYSATPGNKLTINDGSFHNNTAESKTGGVVHCTGTLTVKGGEYYDNTAVTSGGAINIAYISGSQPAVISGAHIHGNSLTGSTDAGGAIGVAKNVTLTLANCNIYDNASDYKSNTNPGADISLLENTTLNLKDNTNVGVINLRAATATVNVREEYTGKAVLVPYNDTYTIGSKLVKFTGGAATSAENIIVRKYTAEAEYRDDLYCVDEAGTLQYKNPEALIGETIYLTFGEAIAAAKSGDTIYVLKDIEVDETITVGSAETPMNLTIANARGKDVKLTRTGSAAMFDVAAGSTLTIGSADAESKLTVDGGYVADAETELIGASLVSNAGTFTLEANATIQNAHTANSNTAANLGGALNNAENATATIRGSIRGCRAFNGGAIYNAKGGEVSIEKGAVLSGNTTQAGNGGAIRNMGTLKITEARFTGNKGEGDSTTNLNGGAIYNTGALTITDTIFEGNSGRSGGAIYNGQDGNFEIVGGSFTGNSANPDKGTSGGTGGAIYVHNKSGNELSITGATFTQNSSKTNNSAAIDLQKTITLKDCNIHDNVSSASSNNVVYDIRLNATLNVAGNTKTGMISYQDKTSGKVNLAADFTGRIILVPNAYADGTEVVTFANNVVDKEALTNRITVRQVNSNTSFDDTTYYVDQEGKVQTLPGAVKVGNDYYDTLTEAVAAVSGENTVYVLKDIEVGETIAIPTDANVTIANGLGRNITITRTGSAAMFDVAAGSTLTIGSADTESKLTVDGGYVADAETPLTGVPLVSNAGTFTLEANATLQNAVTGGSANNDNYRGGALNNKATATIKGTIRDCSAFNGGAIYNGTTGNVLITASAYITENRADGGNGGAIRNEGTIMITGATFTGNKGEGSNGNGGAIYNSGTVKATNAIFEENSGRSGGAIYNNNVSSKAALTIEGGKFTGNSASVNNGGAIFASGTSVTIKDAEFTKNSSDDNLSAAIEVRIAIELKDCNIHDNVSSASSDSAVYDVQLGNANAIANLAGSTNTGVIYQSNASGRVNIGTDFTGSIILVPNTYADGTSVVTFANEVTDKADIASKIVVGKVISGRVENTGKYYIDADGKVQSVTEAAKVGDTSYATLAEALEAVTTEDATTIYLLNNTEFDGTLAIGSADVKRNITIANLAGEDIVLTRAAANAMISVANGSCLTIACSEDGTITVDGNKDLETPHLIKNEGSFVLETSATIQNAVTGGSKNEEPYNGAALYNVGTAILKGSFTGCSAYNGGAIYNAVGAKLEVIGATFTSNITVGGNGGAIRNLGELTVRDTLFTENRTSTANSGGAIYSSDGTLKVENTEFNSNYAYAGGGAIYATSACEITGCDFNGNVAGHNTGGAVYASAKLIITGGTYSENQAATGGGVVNVAGTATITGATMHDNSLTTTSGNTFFGGAAIYVGGGKTLDLVDSNIYNNTSSYDTKVPSCDICVSNTGTLTRNGVIANDNDDETIEQCLVYQSGKLYYVDENGELKENT